MPEPAEAEELILIALAQNGDRDALDIALIIFRNLGYLHHPAAFRAWVLRLASRQIFRHLKVETRRRRLGDSDPELISAAEAPTSTEPLIEPGLLAAIDQLSPASRAVLLLHYQQELSLEETAAVLEIPLGTVKSRLSYGVSVLRKLLQQKGTS